MATEKIPKPIVYPVCDSELLNIIRAIYTRWTGQQFADAVAEIRRDKEQQKEIGNENRND